MLILGNFYSLHFTVSHDWRPLVIKNKKATNLFKEFQ